VAAPVRTAQQREFDLGRIARWYRQGVTASEMADRIGVTRQQIGYDLREIRRRWVDAQIVNFHEAKAVELTRVDCMILRAEGFLARSCPESATVKKQWADVLLKCVDQRCKILGLYAPTKVEPPVPVNDFRDILDELTPDERIALHRVITRPVITVRSGESSPETWAPLIGTKDAGLPREYNGDCQAIEGLTEQLRPGAAPGKRGTSNDTEIGMKGAAADVQVANLPEHHQTAFA
jgi:hypothetical protein